MYTFLSAVSRTHGAASVRACKGRWLLAAQQNHGKEPLDGTCLYCYFLHLFSFICALAVACYCLFVRGEAEVVADIRMLLIDCEERFFRASHSFDAVRVRHVSMVPLSRGLRSEESCRVLTGVISREESGPAGDRGAPSFL